LKKLTKAQLRDTAICDPLTGIFNQQHFFEEAEKSFQHTLRYKEPLAALMIDVDHFKNINDTYGHQAGDEALKVLASYLRKSIRNTDTLGRYGGEEFVILLSFTSLAGAQTLANRLYVRWLEQPVQTARGLVNLAISIGVAVFDPETDHSVTDIVQKADLALYVTKRNGRDRAEVWQQTLPAP
jgi:diguanylate cyclase (GGDEF)-like protein